jgi:hypothetical protein
MATGEKPSTSAGKPRSNREGIDFGLIKSLSREITLYDFAQGIAGSLGIKSGNIRLAKGCTWQTIWDPGGILPEKREYRINNDIFLPGGQIEIEVDGTVVDTLDPGQSRDVKGAKIRVHAPTAQTGKSDGSYDRI